MLLMEGRGHSSLTTMDHRWPVRWRGNGSRWGRPPAPHVTRLAVGTNLDRDRVQASQSRHDLLTFAEVKTDGQERRAQRRDAELPRDGAESGPRSTMIALRGREGTCGTRKTSQSIDKIAPVFVDLFERTKDLFFILGHSCDSSASSARGRPPFALAYRIAAG